MRAQFELVKPGTRDPGNTHSARSRRGTRVATLSLAEPPQPDNSLVGFATDRACEYQFPMKLVLLFQRNLQLLVVLRIGLFPTAAGGEYNQPAVRCKTCHYPLLHLNERRCPECGREFDPADTSTWELESLAGQRRVSWTVLAILIALALFLIAAIIPVIDAYLL